MFLNSETEESSYQNFAVIYTLCINDLLSYGISMGFDEEICQDAAHDVFCNLYIKKKKLKTVQSFTAYLFRAFRNDILNIYKKSAKFAAFKITDLPFENEVSVLDTLISDEEKNRIKGTVEAMLNELTPRQREAIYLRYMQNMDYEEIATLLDMNAGSVRKLVYRSISNLREKNASTENPLVLFILFLLIAGR